MDIKTLPDIYALRCTIERPAVMKVKRGGEWADIPVSEFRDTIRHLSTGLRVLGVKPGDRVSLISENRPEWAMADFAILCAAAISVPVYPTLMPRQMQHVITDSGSMVVFCSNADQLQKILEIRADCPGVAQIIVFDPPPEVPPGILTMAQVIERGRREEVQVGRGAFDEVRAIPKPEDVATLVYTSGTTGAQKGAMLTHGNIVSNVLAATEVLPMKPGHTALSFLPLSHIFERTADYCYFFMGITVAYAEDVTKVPDNLREVKPELFAGVPRIFEKMRARVLDTVETAPPLRQKIFRWALKVAADRLPYRVERKPMPLGLGLKSALADKLVFRKILDRLGGRVQYVLSGGAALSPELAAFFIGAGLEILEGYGLTETSPVITVNRMNKRRIGTVGLPVPGVEVRIAEDGEILTRGPHVMKGYWNKPEATAEVIDAEGWFHTGDIGLIDADGFLKITDRKKEIIVTAYGKNIAPQPLEARLKESPYVGTPVLIGEGRQFLVALIVPNFERLEREVAATGATFTSRLELVESKAAREIFQKEIDRFNADLDRVQQIRRFAILSRDFTIDDDEITPSLKVKRRVIDTKYKETIDRLYAEE